MEAVSIAFRMTNTYVQAPWLNFKKKKSQFGLLSSIY